MCLVSISSHRLAQELLSKPDGFITVSFGEDEYVIEDIRRKSNHSNEDDWCVYWTLNCKYGGNGNVKR